MRDEVIAPAKRLAASQFAKCAALAGHNGGPPLDDPDDHVPPWGPNGIKSYFTWKAAYEGVWKVSHDTAKRRLRNAQACGVSYEEYTLVLLDTGRYLQPGDKALIAQIIARRKAR